MHILCTNTNVSEMFFLNNPSKLKKKKIKIEVYSFSVYFAGFAFPVCAQAGLFPWS